MLLFLVEFIVSISFWKYLSPLRMEKRLGQEKGELTNIGSNKGKVKLLCTKGMVCFRLKLFCITSAFALGSCSCIKNIV